MTVFASVQTAADSAPLTWSQVLLAIAAITILALAVGAPVICSEWRKARRRVPRETPLPPQRADVARPFTERVR